MGPRKCPDEPFGGGGGHGTDFGSPLAMSDTQGSGRTEGTHPSASDESTIRPKRTDSILVAVDVHGNPEPIVERAAALARGLHCQVTLLHVHEPGIVPSAVAAGVPGFGGLATNPDEGVLMRASETAGRTRLTALQERFPKDIGAETRFEVGDPKEIVPEVAEAYDILVLGASDRALWTRVLDKGVTGEALTRSPCTLVLVPAEERA